MKSRRSPSARLAGLGFEFAAAVGGMAVFGYWLGGYWGNAKLGLLIGALLGVTGSMYNLIRASLAAGRQRAQNEQKSDSRD